MDRQTMILYALPVLAAAGCTSLRGPDGQTGPVGPVSPGGTGWSMGTPIVTYWAGPDMTDAVARQMAEGGWNLVWCRERELDIVHRYGLRAQIQDPLLSPANLDDPAKRQQLDAFVERVRNHPALYAYFIRDEPSAGAFPALGRLVAYLRERDPAHLAYINLFPTYANNEQLGTAGDVITAYQDHLSQYLRVVKPDLVSYDHYHFTASGDGKQYFLNLNMVRECARGANLPFLNIVQACSWTPSMRVPTGDEVRWLVYTSLAYGAQGISYYVYCYPKHIGAIANADGTPTVLFPVLAKVNREFAAIATELQPLQSLGAFHAGMVPPNAASLPADAPFRVDPPLPLVEYVHPKPVQGMLLGVFGPAADRPTHVLVVNLDYGQAAVTTVVGPGRLEIFAPETARWQRADGDRARVELPPGGGRLLRLRR